MQSRGCENRQRPLRDVSRGGGAGSPRATPGDPRAVPSLGEEGTVRLRRRMQVPARARPGRRRRRRRPARLRHGRPTRGCHAVRSQAPRAEQEQGGRLPTMAGGDVRVRDARVGRGGPGRGGGQGRARVRAAQPQRDPGDGGGSSADAAGTIRATVQVGDVPQEPIPRGGEAAQAPSFHPRRARSSPDVPAPRRVRPGAIGGREASGGARVARALARHEVVAPGARGRKVGTRGRGRGREVGTRGRGTRGRRVPRRGVQDTRRARATRDDVLRRASPRYRRGSRRGR